MTKESNRGKERILHALQEVEWKGKDGFAIGIGGPDDEDVDIAAELKKGVYENVITKKQISEAQKKYENGRGETYAQEIFDNLEKYGVHPRQLDSPNEVSALEIGVKNGLFTTKDVQRKLALYESRQGRIYHAFTFVAIVSFVAGFALLSPSITGNAVVGITEGVANPLGSILLLVGMLCSALVLGLGKKDRCF